MVITVERKELLAWLEAHKWNGNGNGFMFEEGINEDTGKMGVFLVNRQFFKEHELDEGTIHVEYDTLAMKMPGDIETASHCGRHVDQITRVTGFFSKASGWNAGKRAELVDRHRSDVEANT